MITDDLLRTSFALLNWLNFIRVFHLEFRYIKLCGIKMYNVISIFIIGPLRSYIRLVVPFAVSQSAKILTHYAMRRNRLNSKMRPNSS